MERVYVANLPPDIRIKDIDDFFRPFGKLVYIDVNHRANPVYAYVQFDSARNAFNAVKSRHGYDYEGYTLQLRLVENEVRKRRDATPPPPPPPMFNIYERQNNDVGFNNNFGSNFNRNRSEVNFSSSSFQSNSNSQWSNSRSDMQQQQQNMSQYTTTNNMNMSQQIVPYSSSGHSSMQQQYSNTNRSNMQQQYSNTNRLTVQQQYSNTNRLNMQQQYPSRSDMPQQNLMNYSSTNRSNMPPQQQNMNMMDYSNNGSWDVGNRSAGWNSGNYSSDRNNYDNAGSSRVYNSNNDRYAMPGFEDSYTSGLSGSGRKWFNRYIRKGFSPEMARMKALEHRTVPYLREDPKLKKVPGNPTNMALETIGNTIISLLSTNNQVDNSNNDNWGGNYSQARYGNNIQDGNFAMPGTSSTARGRVASQTPRNAVSRQTYIKSRDILRRLRGKRELSEKDRISKKYHTQIVKDYENFEKLSGKPDDNSTSRRGRDDTQIISTLSEAQLLEELRKKKKQLLMAAKRLGRDTNKRIGGAYKKRMKILMNEAGFSELEAKALAVHPLEKLRVLISIKKQYDLAIKKTDFIQANKKVLKKTPKIVVYRNDINYLSSYEKQKLSNLSPRIKDALRACINRIHKYEKEIKLPLTQSKFITLLLNKPGQINTSSQKRQNDNNKGSKAKKTVVVDTKSSDKKEEEKKDNEKNTAVDENPQENNEDNVNNNEDNVDNDDNGENDEDNVDNQDVIDITEENNDDGNDEEQFVDDAENPENEDEDEQNDEIEEQNEEE